ncbi:dipeptidase [Alicyclobacillus fastidiosus]|uniref:Dipeptidase n=1 Tax=Alicyclobacillus fastidiosus TaxID=392011 RepID=A0ABY6ZL06_9BACL|nr:dipeptidase [Alicyclobacillus fastidiosus]WAH42861.1 dipeptidase [Alicyclobacillus fastidiosus]GMA64796.1 peptidase M20 [Alicyclobacillus fastidiosus]
MEAIERHLKEHREDHLAQLKSLLSIPSISALSEHKGDVRHAAQFLSEALTEAGFENAEIVETAGHPVVYADWLNAPGKPTVLVYGHYDVQPVDPLHLWQSSPFEPDIRDNQIYARGASDDKGPTFMHIKALEAILKENGELPLNIKFCIEGEEEVGSAHLEATLEAHKAKFQADLVLISDTTMLAPDQPSICYGLRGLAACQIDLRTANSDLHSGLYGGAVPNAVHALVELLDTLHAPDGTITVDGFYDEVVELSPAERLEYEKLPHDDEAYRKSLDLPALHGEPGYSTLERLWARPTLELNGIYGGFQGEGTKTVIPNEAHAKITCRLVPDQDPNTVLDLIEAHVTKHAPVGSTVTLIRQEGGHPYLAPYDHPAIQLAAQAYTKAYGVQAVFTRMGGSIPVVETFSQLFHIPIVLMGFGLSDENFHAPNEHFSLDNFDKGLRTLCYYYLNLPTVLGNAPN